MSVLLTACRHSKQRAIERAMKKRAEKQKLKKEAELMQLETDEHYADDVSKCWSFLVNGEQFTVVLYLASDDVSKCWSFLVNGKQFTVVLYLASDDVSKCWSFLVNGEQFTVVLYLASGKETVDIYVNDEENLNVMTNVTSDGITFDFLLGISYKARISCTGNPHNGMTYAFTIDGYPVPE